VDREEAGAIADAIVAELRSVPYGTLTERLLGEVETREVTGPSGVAYQAEIHGLWDTGQPGPLRVIVGVDDGTFRGAFRPVARDFLADGTPQRTD
jgi:hypothetical protein